MLPVKAKETTIVSSVATISHKYLNILLGRDKKERLIQSFSLALKSRIHTKICLLLKTMLASLRL